MKKSRLFIALVAGLALSGCDFQADVLGRIKHFFTGSDKEQSQEEGKKEQAEPAKYVPTGKWEYEPEIIGGTEDDWQNILDTINNKPICNQNGKSSNEIFPESNLTLREDDGDGLKLTTMQMYAGKNTVYLSWDIDQTQTYFGERLISDEAHDIIEIAYQHYGAPQGTFEWKLAQVECGEAVAHPNLEYSAKVENEEYKHDDMTIGQICAIHDEEKTIDAGGVIHKYPSTFDIIDYEYDADKESYSPYFPTNNPDAPENNYLYLNVPGKIVYTAPDGNWGLLADGKNMLEIYAGSGTKFTEKNWPNLAKEYVKVSGNMSQYCGNIQMGFVTKIVGLKDSEKAKLTEPSPLVYRNIDEALLSSLVLSGYSGQKQAVVLDDGTCLMNSLGSVTGTLVAGSIKNKDGDTVDASAVKCSARFTFELQVGSRKIQVAYDYHTDQDGKQGLFNALQAALTKGGQMTIKGTMRYSGNDSLPFIIDSNNPGVWSIVPFLSSHVA